MLTIWLSLLAMLITPADPQLVKIVAFLLAENRILRKKLPKRISVSFAEKHELLKLGQAVGAKMGGEMSFPAFWSHFWICFCRIGVRAGDGYYTENLAKGSSRRKGLLVMNTSLPALLDISRTPLLPRSSLRP